MKSIIVLLMALSLAGCSDSGSDKKPAGGPSPKGDNQSQNTTDYSQCSGASEDQELEGRWTMSMEEENGLKNTMIIDIRAHSMVLSHHCELLGRQLLVSVQVPSRYDESQLETLGAQQDEDEINEKDFNMNCSVQVEPQKMEYQLQGSCLNLKLGNESGRFVRSKQ